MGYLGKILIGGTVGALSVAAVPFTGSGSLFGGATLFASLTGAGVIAGATGGVGVGAGAIMQYVEDKHKEGLVKRQKQNRFKKE
ncbi:MAG: hypothetical protein R3Y47_01200 [Lachnospiraceae bacterium]